MTFSALLMEHFTVVCLLLPAAFEWWCWPCFDRNLPAFLIVNDAVLMLISRNLSQKSSEVSIKTRSTPASWSFKGQVINHKTVKINGVLDRLQIVANVSFAERQKHHQINFKKSSWSRVEKQQTWSTYRSNYRRERIGKLIFPALALQQIGELWVLLVFTSVFRNTYKS